MHLYGLQIIKWHFSKLLSFFLSLDSTFFRCRISAYNTELHHVAMLFVENRYSRLFKGFDLSQRVKMIFAIA